MRCKNCLNRTAECHTTCESYLRYEKRNKEKNEREKDIRYSMLLKKISIDKNKRSMYHWK